MKFKDCPLSDELKEGLFKYGRENNISPFSLIESLLEEFLYKEGYLIVGAGEEIIPFPSELNRPKIKHTQMLPSGKLRVGKRINGPRYNFCACNYEDAENIIDFLESKNWDLKYSTSQTKLRGKKQVEFLFNEMKKEKKGDG